jgi:hypothetical protein
MPVLPPALAARAGDGVAAEPSNLSGSELTGALHGAVRLGVITEAVAAAGLLSGLLGSAKPLAELTLTDLAQVTRSVGQ